MRNAKRGAAFPAAGHLVPQPYGCLRYSCSGNAASFQLNFGIWIASFFVIGAMAWGLTPILLPSTARPRTHSTHAAVVTYTALISAYERGGQWQKALQAFHKMCVQGCKPDAIVYNAIIDTLWETGIIWAQGKALQLFLTGVQQGHFRQEPLVRRPGRVEVNLHAMTAGVAMVCLYCWLLELK